MKKIVGFISICILSVFYVIVTFFTFVYKDEILISDLKYTNEDLYNVLPFSIWLLTVGLVLGISWLIWKKISPNYRYHFTVLAITLFLFSYTPITNRGWNWFMIGMFLGIPALIINYWNNIFKAKCLHMHLQKSLSAFFIVFIFGGFIEYLSTDSMAMDNDEYSVYLSAYTIPTFVDWQIEGDIYLEDKLTGKRVAGEFWFGQGPYFEVCKDIHSDSLMYIKGMDYNAGHDWKVNLNSGEIRRFYSETTIPCKEIVVFE